MDHFHRSTSYSWEGMADKTTTALPGDFAEVFLAHCNAVGVSADGTVLIKHKVERHTPKPFWAQSLPLCFCTMLLNQMGSAQTIFPQN